MGKRRRGVKYEIYALSDDAMMTTSAEVKIL